MPCMMIKFKSDPEEQHLGEIATSSSSSELREWSHLPDLVISDVLRRLVPCLRSLSAFAATCRPWRRFFAATASTDILPRIPPLILQARRYTDRYAHVLALSSLVLDTPAVAVPMPAFRSTLLSSSRGHLVLLAEPRDAVVVVDALTGAERLSIPLPSPWIHPPCQYATLTRTRLLIFFDYAHEFVSFPFPPRGNPLPEPEWTRYPLPSEASSISAVIDFHGRVLGVTDRAELLEFFRLDGDQEAVAELLPTTGIPEDATFERWQLGPRLVVAGGRLLFLLVMTDSPEEHRMVRRLGKVVRVSVHALDAAAMRWEELDGVGEYSLLVDCAGRTAVACVDGSATGEGGGVLVPNRVYFLVSRFYYCVEHGRPPFQAFPPGADCGDRGRDSPWDSLISDQREWLASQTWVYPRLLYRC